jgi:peroxisomal membrane protein 4
MQGLVKLLLEKRIVEDSSGSLRKYAWPVFASVTWAAVMYLFRWHPQLLQVISKSILFSVNLMEIS